MAYSRWGGSIWYCFWLASEKKYGFPTKDLKDKQLFEICDFPSYMVSYGTIKAKGIDGVVKEIEDFFSKTHNGQMFKGFSDDGEMTYGETTFEAKNPTTEELNELKGYLELFVKDVDEHFKWKNFFYYEWYLELRQDIRKLFDKKKKRSQ